MPLPGWPLSDHTGFSDWIIRSSVPNPLQALCCEDVHICGSSLTGSSARNCRLFLNPHYTYFLNGFYGLTLPPSLVRFSFTVAQRCAIPLLAPVRKAAPGRVSTWLDEISGFEMPLMLLPTSPAGRDTHAKIISSEQTVVSSGEVTLVMWIQLF